MAIVEALEPHARAPARAKAEEVRGVVTAPGRRVTRVDAVELARVAHMDLPGPKISEVPNEGSRAKGVRLMTYTGARAPLDKFVNPVAGQPPQPIAFFNTEPDANDGVIRRSGLVLEVRPKGSDTSLLVPNLEFGGVLKYWGVKRS